MAVVKIGTGSRILPPKNFILSFAPDQDIFKTFVGYVHIAWLFSKITVHGSLPDSFTVNTVVPIPKSHNVNIHVCERQFSWNSFGFYFQ